MSRPLVSVIIPTFNRADLLNETLRSVTMQTYSELEILVVDDGSTDTTAEMLNEWSRREHRLRVIRQINRGVALARQRGFDASAGEFIQFLDSDDLLSIDKIEAQAAVLTVSSEYDVAYSPTFYFREDWTASEPSRKTGEQVEDLLLSMISERVWRTVSPLYRRSVCLAAGPWEPLVSEEDWEFDVRVAASGARAKLVEKASAFYRVRLESEKVDTDDKFRSRARAHELIAAHARTAGVPLESPEVGRFARYTFLLARQCAERGLSNEARRLLSVAYSLRPSTDMKMFQLAATCLGWRTTERIATWIRELR